MFLLKLTVWYNSYQNALNIWDVIISLTEPGQRANSGSSVLGTRMYILWPSGKAMIRELRDMAWSSGPHGIPRSK